MAEINTEWLKNLKERIDAIPDCRALNELIKYLREMFNELIEDILNQIAKLIGLIIPPTSLAKIIKYLKNLATRYLGPYLSAIRQMAQMIKAFADVLAAVQNKLANLKCSISPQAIFNQMKIDLTSKAYAKLYSGYPTVGQLFDIAVKLKNGIPPLSIIASSYGVNIDGLPAIANQFGGTLPFMSQLLDKYQPAPVPNIVIPILPETPTEIALDNPAPTIDYLNTGSVDALGGTALVITGTGFLTGPSVKISEVDCENIVLDSNTQISCSSPVLPIGSGYSLTVTNTDGQSATLPNSITAISI